MLYDRVEDVASVQAETMRYLLSAVSRNTVQTTLTTLEQHCARSVAFHRYTIRCACSALLASRNEEKALLASRLVQEALQRPNGLTLVATALDGCATTLTADSLTTLMATELKLSPMQQMQMAMALVLGGSATAKAAATDLLEGFNVPQAALRETDGGVRAAALLSRQVGLAPAKLDAQLTSICHPTPVAKNTLAAKATPRVSVAGILQELGIGCVTTLADSRELLSIFPHHFTEQDGAEVLAFFAAGVPAVNDPNTYTSLMTAAGKAAPRGMSTATLVNAMPLLDALSEGSAQKSLDWNRVIALLDVSNGEPFRAKHISVIFDAYHRFHADNEYPAIDLFLGRWGNTARQRGLLEYVLRHPDRVNRKALAIDAPAELLPATKPPGVTAPELELWRSSSFVEAAVHVASREKEFDAEVLRPAMEKLPLLFLHTLLTGSFPGTIKHFVCIKHLLKSHCPSLDPVAQLIVPGMEQRGRLDLIIGALSDLVEAVPERTIEVMQVVLKCKSMAKRVLSDSGSPRLVTAVAMCMDEAGEPSDKWLLRALEGKLHFRASTTENRFAVAISLVEMAEVLQEKQLFASSATAALNALLASPLRDVLKSVTDCAKTLLASTDSLYPEDVESEAMELFKKMYAAGNTTTAVATMAQLMKGTAARDTQLYACIIGILFEESSAIAFYPRKELRLFAELYGQLLAQDLLPANQVQRAWGVLLPALAKPENYSIEEYGIIALEQVKSRLPDWPTVGRALRHLRDLDFRVPGIKAAIYRGIKMEDDAARGGGAVADADTGSPTSPKPPAGSPSKTLASLDPAIVTSTSTKRTFAELDATRLHTHDIGTLVTNAHLTAPPPVIQEQINFLIGNTDVRNLETNASELAQLLRPEYHEYFADYLVVKRAALEPNYHAMYIDLVSRLRSRDLDQALRKATIAAVHRLLSSDKIGTDSGERVLLRNLGSWLGSITLEKNIPILQQDLHFRTLLCKGLREGRLVPVVSLITRVLMSCAKSRFFCPPNPWTMAQLCLLMEMYNLPHLRVTLRFELELLLKAHDQTLQDVLQYMHRHASNATTELRLMDVYEKIDIYASPDFRVEEDEDTGMVTVNPASAATKPSPNAQQQQQQLAGSLRGSARPLQANAEPFQPKDAATAGPAAVAGPAVPVAGSEVDQIMPRLNKPLRPPVVITAETVHLPATTNAAIDGAMKRLHSCLPQIAETLQAVVEQAVQYCMQRSVAIAARTTERLVVKDFARDPHPEDILIAGDGMARSLASSLSFVLVREELPALLQSAVADLMKQVLEPSTPMEFKVAVSQALLQENYELCLRAVEYSVGEQAATATTRALYDVAKEKAAAAAAGEPLPLPADQIEAVELLRVMGEPLVPSGRVPAMQRQVYDDFYHCVPPVAAFTAALRGTEEAVNRYLTKMDASASAAPPQLQFAQLEVAAAAAPTVEISAEDAQAALRQHVARLVSLISPESAILFLSPIFNRLMPLAVHMDRLNKKATASANAGTQQPQPPSSQPPQEGEDAANAAEDDPVLRAEALRLSAVLHQLYLHLLLRCRERGGEPVTEEFTRLLLQNEHCYTFSKLTTELLRARLILCARFDEALALALASGASNYVTFAGDIITAAIIKEKIVASKEMRRTLAALDTIARTRTRQPVAPPAPAHTSPSYAAGPSLSKLVPAHVTKLVVPCASVGADESSAFHKDVEKLMNDWITVWSQKSHRYTERRIPSVEFVKTLQMKQMLDTSHLHTFLGLSVRYCVEYYANTMLAMERAEELGTVSEGVLVGSRPGAPPGYRTQYTTKGFVMCDGFVELVMVLLQCCSLRNEASHDLRAETTLLKRLLEAVARVLTEHHDYVTKARPAPEWDLPADTQLLPVFQQQPYVRLLSDLVFSLHRLESSTARPTSTEFTMAFHGFLRRVHPLEYPGFTFGWMEILSHRFFIPRFMQQESTWDHYADLLTGAMLFVKFLIKGNRISPNGLVYYKTVFKLVLVLLHDYPQFLIGQHYPLCEAIPLSCVQLLNTVLCSFPPEQRLPEPFQHVDSNSPAMLQPVDTRVQETCIKAAFSAAAMDAQLLVTLETMVRKDDVPIHEPVLLEILGKMTQTSAKRSLINAVVQHMAIVYLNSNGGTVPQLFAQSNVLACYRFICSRLNTKHRYYMLGACANQLRYPNIQTNFFSSVVLNLFLPSAGVDAHTQTCIQEQITRVLAEKTIIVQPHPWGVLNTFVELMRDPKYKFWETSFIHFPMLESVFSKLHRTVEMRNGTATPAAAPGGPVAAPRK